MHLSKEENNIYFKNWLDILAFVNDKYQIVKKFGHPKKGEDINLNHVDEIKTKLWENTKIIDEYIKINKKLSDDDIYLLKSWKKRITGKFIILKQLKNYCIFLDEKQENVYGIIGLSNSIAEYLPFIPVYIETTLMPFKDRIAYDGILKITEVQIGKNMAQSFTEEYKRIKEEKGIITELS
ncbi:hypothetical protein [Leadbettera azotonutricia]|uniref:Uncharacterized protein n=1 Tax=Leadbettera azotonutricia (strain ATCC BAA-888 / DSM 13862 / ZAS-9) TaxID=545695 RepID=F5YC71_LEAAZ|nr:hypothetical protein [Leadbettera azotonutricia]AEF82280.1 hypothetical protein TREAZ_0501 [Leadbettera azotonutricia ZAS-9]